MKIELSEAEMAEACFDYVSAKLGPTAANRTVSISLHVDSVSVRFWAECNVTEKKPEPDTSER